MNGDSDQSQVYIKDKAQQILDALKKIAILSNRLHLASLVQDMEVLFLTLPCESILLEETRQIKELYETTVADVEILYAKLQELTSTIRELE